MDINKIIQILQEKYSLDLASSFDIGKIGLQFGSRTSDIHKIMIALDGTSEVVDEAISKNVDLLLTHHPFMFNSLLSLNYDSVFGKKLIKVLSNGLNIYSMHTNFDTAKSGMNELLANKLNLNNIHAHKDEIDGTCFLRIGNIEPTTLDKFVDDVLTRLNVDGCRVIGDSKKIIKKVGIVGGAGASEMNLCIRNGVDCFITGEFRHNNAIDAYENGLAVIEVSHSIEALFKEYLKEELQKDLKDVEIITSQVEKDPFKYVVKK